jgi:exodeoxyribonuclease VII large subunit
MAPKSKSQWDFGGELFPSQEMRRVFSVTEMTVTVRRLLEERVGSVWVSGEVSNCRLQSSGHIYFSLKDPGAQLSCVCFRDDARSTRDLLQDGRKVVLKGDLTVYEARGQYQLLVKAVELEGMGALQAAFERLKQKLAQEGLFASERKRAIPELIHSLALITSPTGAALRDVLHVVQRRHASLNLILASCRVQGDGAADDIVRALRDVNDFARHGNRIDAVLITRGGGSLEDLAPFNSEVLARAIIDSKLPVVSAVGHEIDITISDFVADLRAATPTAGAELLTEGMFRRRQWIANSSTQMVDVMQSRLETFRAALMGLASRLARNHPKRLWRDRWQDLDELNAALRRCAGKEFRRHQLSVSNLMQRLARVRPSKAVRNQLRLLEDLSRRLRENGRRNVTLLGQHVRLLQTRLRLLSPELVLQRGFSITVDAESGRVLRRASEVQAGQRLRTKLHSGEVTSVADGRTEK